MEDETKIGKEPDRPITRWHTLLILLVIAAIIVPIMILSGYGPTRTYDSQGGTTSFKYPLMWHAKEFAVRDELHIIACNQDGSPEGTGCATGIEIVSHPATDTKLADLNVDTGTVKKFDNQTIGGKSFRAYDNGSMPFTQNGHAMIYELIDGGRYYRITAQYAYSPETLSHGQRVVLDSLKF